MKRMKLLFTLTLPVFLCQNLQAQTSSRLVAESQWTNNGAFFLPTDSASFLYASNLRGGDLTHTLKYDTTTYGTYDSTLTYNPQTIAVQTFDGNNNITSITTSQNVTGVGWVLSTKTLYTYNSSNLPINVIQQSWSGTAWTPLTENVYSYTGTNQLEVNQHYTWTGVSFTADTQKVYAYTTSGLIESELDNYTVSGFPYDYRGVTYTYDSSNHLLTVTTAAFAGTITSATPVSLVQYTWDGTNDITSKEIEMYDGATATYVGQTLYTYSSFTGGHNPQMEVVQNWDSTSGTWVNIMEYANTYNTYGQMTTSTGTAWNIVGIYEHAVGDPMYAYYYGTYSSSTISAVKSVVNNNGDAKLYPVPAANVLNVDLSWNTAQSAVIGIYDVTGNMVKQVYSPYGAQYTCSFQVNDLAAGVYFVRISGQQGQIVKQFSVSH